MGRALFLFTCDPRVRENPALAAAVPAPLRQARRSDPDGNCVRRYVPEPGALARAVVHEPWRLPAAERRSLRYPQPIVDPRTFMRAGRAA